MCANQSSPASSVRRTLAALLVLISGVAAVNVRGSSAEPQPSLPLPGSPALPGLPALPTSPPPEPPGRPGALFGAYVQAPGDDHDVQMAAVERRERDIGRRLAIDHHFYPWDKEFPTAREKDDLRNGRIPMISWNGKTLNLAIGLGQHDELIRTRAQAVKTLGGKVLIRWMWEMDGRQKAEHTTHPAFYIAAWRHIHDVFADEGVTNVQWVWCPNATAFRTEDERNAPAYYPGDEYVDWICADGYNWAPGRPNDKWRSFASIYQDFYDWGISRGKPLMVGEYGAQERELLAGRYDMYLLSRSYLTDVPDAGAALQSDYTCDGSYNLNHYCSPAFDSLIATLGTTTDFAARQDVFRAAARMLVDDVVGVPLVHSQENAVARHVVGFTLDPLAKQLVTPKLAVTE